MKESRERKWREMIERREKNRGMRERIESEREKREVADNGEMWSAAVSSCGGGSG
ncbi:hypothetical protein Scep_000569 [Stephania cephalantha]|uniref:Uncharacterized protein n=1 Tax=Stephania cephalantha TaxID=152367 RepID=A0AAP0L7U6_9MAGN